MFEVRTCVDGEEYEGEEIGVVGVKSLLVIGTVLLFVGVVMALFGAVYSTTNHFAILQECTNGCSVSGTISQPIVKSYYLYPIWSPPQYPNQSPPNTVTLCGLQAERQTWYTPINPPPSCLPPPAMTSVSYTLNLIGIVLMLLGIVVVVRGYGHHPTLNRTQE